ncbi:MAG TPA: DUF488 domain-containing protein [Mycolicibacillus parakoreensis]|uniref:DUF488 domain-containing protein n=1 Tax=Mycolicibacillus parakoreensis TaxID=1069221 RepID=A0ABY3U4I0_9MYCO|nr:DUF488 domain-containing protein [Mycolicibacillus parakoreensis]ULN54393.1 DUF488 domain-containing protein [Mycolicibacillus parakoreensis]HLR99732.1 DUF488 domain-containing protein [Mycolicibacillus parakoreensis]
MVTFGHGTADAATITTLLHGASVAQLVDVRTAPGSRHNPDSRREAMAQWLPAAGIGYRWEPRLGGWRRGGDAGPDVGLRNKSFRSYAGYMRGEQFRAAIAELLAGARRERAAIMCAETVWWRCHRKLIADYLTLVCGIEVRHLMHDGALRAHRPTAEARVAGPVLVYDRVAGPP